MPLINISKITTNKAFGIWKINESLNEINHLNKNENLNIDNRIIEKKFKEKVAARMVVKKICENLKLNYYGIKKNKAGKPFLIKNNAKISISHSYPFAVALINTKNLCGIDIEKIREKVLKINPKFLDEDERKLVGISRKKNTIFWCCKEALFKTSNKQNISFRDDINLKEKKKNIIGKIKGEKFKLSIKEIEDFIIAYTN
tara:strand:+ start:64 stop:666 length:603 start_codon:yes stop_codon:yes gene_type:complete